jgi:hypothetical protein
VWAVRKSVQGACLMLDALLTLSHALLMLNHALLVLNDVALMLNCIRADVQLNALPMLLTRALPMLNLPPTCNNWCLRVSLCGTRFVCEGVSGFPT